MTGSRGHSESNGRRGANYANGPTGDTRPPMQQHWWYYP